MNKKKITVALAAVFFIGYIVFDSIDGKFALFEIIKNDFRFVTSVPGVNNIDDFVKLGVDLFSKNFSSLCNI